MSKNITKINGTVIEALPNAQFRVQLEDGNTIRAYIAGKMKLNKIKVLPGDIVIMEIPDNLEIKNCIGRITYRK